MKKLLFFAMAVMLTAATFAQQQFATLNHNDTITAYYGSTALTQAHAAASNGDIITLSSGTFTTGTGSSGYMRKEIKIIGNGMVNDTIAYTEPTIIDRLWLNIPNNSSSSFELDGVKVNNLIVSEAAEPRFNKCMIGNMQTGGSGTFVNGTFENSIITVNQLPSSTAGFSFYNCYINFSYYYTGTGTDNTNSYNLGTLSTCMNCVIYMPRTHASIASTTNTFINCIMYDLSSTADLTTCASHCTNCIGIYTGTAEGGYFIDCNDDAGNHNFNSFGDVFKNFDGTNYELFDFELQDSIAANIMGNADSPIGMIVPFNPRVNTPRYVRANVAPRTTLDGKLSVDIEVVSE